MSKKNFKPHKMYKDGKSVMANTYEDHLALGKKGYDHSPLAKKCNCWKGYKRVKGTKPCAPGSCKKASSVKITEEAYEKRNRKMRSKHKSETGKTLGDRKTSGTNPRRVSFACRFAGMKGSMKKPNGEPTPYAMALKKWGFGSREAAASFCRKNKGKSPAKYDLSTKKGRKDYYHGVDSDLIKKSTGPKATKGFGKSIIDKYNQAIDSQKVEQKTNKAYKTLKK